MVDLGANIGVFTLLALAHGPNVKVVSVEPGASLSAAFSAQLALNGWQDRAVLERAFLGGHGPLQEFLERDDYRRAHLNRRAHFV